MDPIIGMDELFHYRNKAQFPVGRNKEGKIVGTAQNETTLQSESAESIYQTIEVTSPHLWSLDDPYMHTLVSRVFVDGEEVDREETSIGIRKITMDAENGIMINGEHAGFLSGVNRHQEYPYIGYAASSSLQRRDAINYKSAGFNIVRTAHHPQSEDFLPRGAWDSRFLSGR